MPMNMKKILGGHFLFLIAIVGLFACRTRETKSAVKNIDQSIESITWVAYCRDVAQGDVAKECLIQNDDIFASSPIPVWVRTSRSGKQDTAEPVETHWLQDGLLIEPLDMYQRPIREKAIEYDTKDKNGKNTDVHDEVFTIHQRGDAQQKVWTKTDYVYPLAALLKNRIYCHRNIDQKEICFTFERNPANDGTHLVDEVTISSAAVTKKPVTSFGR